MKKLFGCFLCMMLLVFAFTAPAYSAPINLNTWSQEGILANGSWAVQDGGNSVFQSINGNPTYFVSPESFINKKFEGSFRVEETGDNDYIGFVFGFGDNDSDPFYLFDWKQGLQNGSAPGGYLSYVTGGSSAIPFDNHHLDAAGYDVLATNLGTGWADNTWYDFTLEYQTNNIKIDIAGGVFGTGQTIFDYSGSFSAGRFGFYNYSQPFVRYQGFEEAEAPPSVPEPATMLLLGSGLIGLVGFRRKKLFKE